MTKQNTTFSHGKAEGWLINTSTGEKRKAFDQHNFVTVSKQTDFGSIGMITATQALSRWSTPQQELTGGEVVLWEEDGDWHVAVIKYQIPPQSMTYTAVCSYYSLVPLTPPCVQTPSEVLVVTYRLYFKTKDGKHPDRQEPIFQPRFIQGPYYHNPDLNVNHLRDTIEFFDYQGSHIVHDLTQDAVPTNAYPIKAYFEEGATLAVGYGYGSRLNVDKEKVWVEWKVEGDWHIPERPEVYPTAIKDVISKPDFCEPVVVTVDTSPSGYALRLKAHSWPSPYTRTDHYGYEDEVGCSTYSVRHLDVGVTKDGNIIIFNKATGVYGKVKNPLPPSKYKQIWPFFYNNELYLNSYQKAYRIKDDNTFEEVDLPDDASSSAFKKQDDGTWVQEYYRYGWYEMPYPSEDKADEWLDTPVAGVKMRFRNLSAKAYTNHFLAVAPYPFCFTKGYVPISTTRDEGPGIKDIVTYTGTIPPKVELSSSTVTTNEPDYVEGALWAAQNSVHYNLDDDTYGSNYKRGAIGNLGRPTKGVLKTLFFTTSTGTVVNAPVSSLAIGSILKKTGVYNPNFVTVVSYGNNSVKIDGVEASICLDGRYPAPGEASIPEYGGRVIFNHGDIGKTVEFSLECLYHKPLT